MQLVFIAFAIIAIGLVSHSNACGTQLTQPTRPTQPIPTEEKPCGYLPPNQPNRQLIHDGITAKPGQWPWQAFILIKKMKVSEQESGIWNDWCSGVIIDSEWILTAAHCLYPSKNTSDYCVVVGHNLVDLKPFVDNFVGPESCSPFGRKPLQVIRHPIFDENDWDQFNITHPEFTEQVKRSTYHDIALIKMAPISFATRDVGRICLPTEDAGSYYDQSCHVAGWGYTENGRNAHQFSFKSLKSHVWSEFECHTFSVFEILFKFTKNFYCFGDKNANICYGDSGSALVCKRSNGQFETVGVAVMMDYPPCGEPYPGQKASYFVRVPTLLNWIKATIESNTASKKNYINIE